MVGRSRVARRRHSASRRFFSHGCWLSPGHTRTRREQAGKCAERHRVQLPMVATWRRKTAWSKENPPSPPLLPEGMQQFTRLAVDSACPMQRVRMVPPRPPVNRANMKPDKAGLDSKYRFRVEHGSERSRRDVSPHNSGHARTRVTAARQSRSRPATPPYPNRCRAAID